MEQLSGMNALIEKEKQEKMDLIQQGLGASSADPKDEIKMYVEIKYSSSWTFNDLSGTFWTCYVGMCLGTLR